MHFLILTQYFPPETGAPQVRLAAMIRELLRLGHTVEVVTALPNYPEGQIFPDYQGYFYKLDEWEGISIHRVWMYAATGAGIKRLFNYFSFMLTAFWGLRKAQKPDYLFVESPPLFLGISGYLIAKWWRVPFIFNVADLWPDTVKALGLMRDGLVLRLAEKLEQWLYRKANYVTVVTESVRQILMKQKQVPASKVLLLPNGVDTQLFKPYAVKLKSSLTPLNQKEKLSSPEKTALISTYQKGEFLSHQAWEEFEFPTPLPNHKYLLLYAGTHGYAHGMEIIVEAAQLLMDMNVLFLCVGGGSDKNRIQQLCEDKALKNILFWPSQPPQLIAHLYNLAFAGISTFRDSPLLECTRPAKTLPILASGKPVLFSGAGDTAQLVTAAKAGIIIPPGDSKGLANAIRYLINKPDEAKQLGLNGRVYAKKHLEWSQVVAAWFQQLNTR
jgi:glycosyltransferase involved in cell wall biosynthesis